MTFSVLPPLQFTNASPITPKAGNTAFPGSSASQQTLKQDVFFGRTYNPNPPNNPITLPDSLSSRRRMAHAEIQAALPRETATNGQLGFRQELIRLIDASHEDIINELALAHEERRTREAGGQMNSIPVSVRPLIAELRATVQQIQANPHNFANPQQAALSAVTNTRSIIIEQNPIMNPGTIQQLTSLMREAFRLPQSNL